MTQPTIIEKIAAASLNACKNTYTASYNGDPNIVHYNIAKAAFSVIEADIRALVWQLRVFTETGMAVDYYKGVMFTQSTIDDAKKVLESLPPQIKE